MSVQHCSLCSFWGVVLQLNRVAAASTRLRLQELNGRRTEAAPQAVTAAAPALTRSCAGSTRLSLSACECVCGVLSRLHTSVGGAAGSGSGRSTTAVTCLRAWWRQRRSRDKGRDGASLNAGDCGVGTLFSHTCACVQSRSVRAYTPPPLVCVRPDGTPRGALSTGCP